MDNKYISPAQAAARKANVSQTGKKELLIKTGVDMILKNGYEKTSIEDITKKCGVAKGTFYYYFQTKEDLLKAGTIGLNDKKIIEDLKELPWLSIIEKVKYYIRMFAEMMENEIGWEFNRLWARMVLDSDESDLRLRLDREQLMGIFEEGIKKGELKPNMDYNTLCNMILDYIYGTAFTWDLDKEGMHILGTVDLFCEAVEVLMQRYLLK